MFRAFCVGFLTFVLGVAVVSVDVVAWESVCPDEWSLRPGISYNQAFQSQVYLRGPGFTGSGVEGTVRGVPVVLTCAHCCMSYQDEDLILFRDIEVTAPGKNDWRPLIVLAVDKEADVAVLLQTKPRSSARIDLLKNLSAPELGDTVAIFGNPEGCRDLCDFGDVAQLGIRGSSGRPWTAIHTHCWYGSSGGPAFRKVHGRFYLCGLCSGLFIQYRDVPGLTRFVRAVDMLAIMDRAIPQPTSD